MTMYSFLRQNISVFSGFHFSIIDFFFLVHVQSVLYIAENT